MDLMTYDAPRFRIYDVLGFSPGRAFSVQQNAAINGIAYIRGREVLEDSIKVQALQALHQAPGVSAEFAAVFPFIQSGYQTESIGGR